MMTVEQVKEEAKKRFNKDITDEQAQAWLEAHPAGELQDEELENVAGGCGDDNKYTMSYEKNSAKMGPCPRCRCNEHRRIKAGLPQRLGNINYWCVECGMKFSVSTEKWVE